ncbi:energy transducer TonB [Chryseobacterium defluvii]|uniref:Protein TonB n=1 Tax=Chryseobacterium defluvii TaxID=160396 RepID=A0A495SD95_9FLAO|nr:energy transducer TonB [Chryseobacterium defluvii]RKS97473.1 protein TonB [Chryseobacterium defluvii]
MKHLQHNQEFRLNEILFEHRNKEYGAYVLRNESDRLLTKALFVGVGLLAAISITPMLISTFKNDVPTEGPGGVVIEFVDPVVPDVPETPPVQPVQPTAPEQQTFNSAVPTPSSNAPDEPIKDIPETAKPGLVDNFKPEPNPSDTYVPTTSNTGIGPIVPEVKPQPPVEKTDPNKIADAGELSKEADFVGGINSFRNKVISNFDGSGFEGSGDLMKTTITFIVETDGTISGIKANGGDADFNNEAIRTIKSVKGKWVPGKNKKGEAVRSYFKFPISMKFE